MDNPTRNSNQLAFYRRLFESGDSTNANTFHQAVEQKTYFVTFRKDGVVIDVVVPAAGKKDAREKAQAIVAGNGLCGEFRYVGVN